MPAKTKQKEKQNKKQKQKTDKTKRGAPLLGLAKSIYYWLVAHVKFKTYCCLCTVKAKNDNKNIKQRTLLSFITRFFY